VNGEVATGIDLLVSTICKETENLRISKVRCLTLFRQIGENTSSFMPSLVRLTEMLASLLSQGRLAEPFWEFFADRIYDENCPVFPDIVVTLANDGREMMEHLMKNAGDYIEPYKYRDLKTVKPAQLIKELAAICENEQERLDGKDRLPDLELDNSFV
jgi:hypothetical protein